MDELRKWAATDRTGRVNFMVLLTLGGAGFLGSAGHILRVARLNGQEGLGAWTVVGTVEILAAYTGWQVKLREGWRRWVALVILAAAVVFTVAANLEASPVETAWGLIMAVAPALVFVAAVVMAETAERPTRVAAKASRMAKKVAPAQSPSSQDVANPEPPVQVVKPQVKPVDAVLAVMRAGADMGMGEIIEATSLPRSTAKKAICDLLQEGRVNSFGDRTRPRYALVMEPPQLRESHAVA